MYEIKYNKEIRGKIYERRDMNVSIVLKVK